MRFDHVHRDFLIFYYTVKNKMLILTYNIVGFLRHAKMLKLIFLY